MTQDDAEKKEWEKIDWDNILPKGQEDAPELPPEPDGIKKLDPRVNTLAIHFHYFDAFVLI